MSKRKKILALVFAIFVFGIGGFFYAEPVSVGIAAMRIALRLQGFSHQTEPVDGFAMSYFERNPQADRCVILIHGLADQAGTWWRVVGEFDDSHVIAFDLPGHGESGPDDGDIGMPEVQAEMKAVLYRCSPEPALLVGNSLGGFIALRTALDQPERVRAVVAIDAGGMPMSFAQDVFLPQTREQMGQTMSRVLGENFTQPPGFILDDMREYVVDGATPRLWKAITSSTTLDTELHKIRVPTLVVWGADDGLIPVALGRKMASEIPGAQFHEIPNCGHAPQATCPGQFVPILRTFLSREAQTENHRDRGAP